MTIPDDLSAFLEDNYLQWGRFENNDIYIYTSGYFTAECYVVEQEAMKHNWFCLTMEFDKQCGKTKMVLRNQSKE